MDYKTYIQSDAWRVRQRQAVTDAGGKCERCNSISALGVHHKSYARLGAELKEDLEVICIHCHAKSHPDKFVKHGRYTAIHRSDGSANITVAWKGKAIQRSRFTFSSDFSKARKS